MNKDYYLKYIKYKNKYTKLSNILGGAAAENPQNRLDARRAASGTCWITKGARSLQLA